MIHCAAFTTTFLARADRALLRHMPNLMAPVASNYLTEDPHCGYNEALNDLTSTSLASLIISLLTMLCLRFSVLSSGSISLISTNTWKRGNKDLVHYYLLYPKGNDTSFHSRFQFHEDISAPRPSDAYAFTQILASICSLYVWSHFPPSKLRFIYVAEPTSIALPESHILTFDGTTTYIRTKISLSPLILDHKGREKHPIVRHHRDKLFYRYWHS